MRRSLAITGVLLVIACGTLESTEPVPVASDGGTSGEDAGLDGCTSCVAPDAATAHVLALSAGESFRCALRDDGTVACWGNNNNGMIGQPPDGDLACDSPNRCRPAPIVVPGLSNVAQVTTGFACACARLESGEVDCWGTNAHGCLGNGTTSPAQSYTPTRVALPGPAIDVAGGFDTMCARIAEDGGAGVYCWGSAGYGMLGKPIDGSVRAPMRFPELTGAVQIGMSPTTGIGCAVLSDASVVCWGISVRGDLGHTANSAGDVPCTTTPSIFCNPTPAQIGDATFKALEVQTGQATMCARTLTGGVACWGDNDFGALGIGTFDSADHPTPQAVPSLAGASALSLRTLHACAIVGDELRCWGADIWGELGDALASPTCTAGLRCQSKPTKVAAVTSPKLVAVGNSFTIAIDGTSRAWGWGANVDGRSGHAPGTSNDLATCGSTTTRCNPSPQPFSF